VSWGRNLSDLLEERSAAFDPLIVELRAGGEERAVGIEAFRQSVDAAARALSGRGHEPGTRIALIAENRAEYLAAYLAIMRAGMVAVPVNYKLPAQVVAHIVADSGCRMAFVDRDRSALAGGLPSVEFDGQGPSGWERFLDPGSFQSVQPAPDDLAMVLYTSGSSGLPKGVPLTHSGYHWAVRGFDPLRATFEGRAVVVPAPFFHMNGLFSSKLLLRLGATNLLMPRFNAAEYLKALHRHRCPVVIAIPTMIALAARETDTLKTVDLTSVQAVILGSAPSSEALIADVRRLFPNAAITNSWGTTEAGPVCFGPHPKGLARPPLALGYPRPDVEVRLVGDSPDLGVLQVRTPALMKGYLNRPEETAKRLKDGWYDTGDIVRRDTDGFYFFVGREDDMFICGGENIYPAEVERLLEAHPAVAQAAVVPLADHVKGQIPVAFVVRVAGAALDGEALKKFALERGPAYAHPRQVIFVDHLPLAGTNKIDRKRLAQEAADHVAARSAKP
jgi:acyl-CoA synthetase (AMP-forming)/AMP-acid ligase II